MKAKLHPTFKKELYKGNIYIVFFAFLAFTAQFAFSFNPAHYFAVLAPAVVFICVFYHFRKQRKFRDAKCAECGHRGELISPSQWGGNYVLECRVCDIAWNLNVKMMPDSDHE